MTEPADARVAEGDRLLAGGQGVAPNPVAAAESYRRAMETGSARAALRLATLAVYGVGRAPLWSDALQFLGFAATHGDTLAQAQLRLLAGAAASATDWRRMSEGIDVETLLRPAPIERLSDKAAVGVSRGFAPPGFSQWIIDRAAGRLGPSYVNDAATGEVRPHPMRTATYSQFHLLQRDLVIAVMQERAARLTQVPVVQHEAPNVISYEPGQKFDFHFDFVAPESRGFQQELATLGQRILTLITYLNEDFEGAATAFPELGFEFRGGIGDALVFSNVLPDGSPDRLTLHAGMPPRSGRKWVLSQWIRNKPQPLGIDLA